MSSSTRRLRSRAVIPTTLLALVLVAAGCGDDDDGGGGGGTAETGASSEALGEEDPAEGEPVTIGYISTGQTQAIDFTPEIRGAEAAAEYINERLGGLHGRPIELIVCEEGGTPAGAQQCGNEMVQEGVAAVVAASPQQVDPWLQIVTAADIPVAANYISTGTSLTDPGVNVFFNPLVAFGGPAAYARANDVQNATMVVIDVPAAADPAARFGPLLFGNAGSEVELVRIAPGTADMTPQFQAAAESDPDMIYIIGDVTFCSSALRAIQTLGLDTQVVVLDRCVSQDAAASIPGGFEGVDVIAQAVFEEGDEEYELYQAVMDAYSDVTDLNRSVSGYQAMLSFARAVNADETPDLTPAGIQEALDTMPAQSYPVGGGETFQCNGEAVPSISPNICSSITIVATGATDGSLSDYQVLDTEGIYDL
ncbi:ABC transporter substrate-binding protein [Trujillonella humicola]|uniref:ABC transporter substrate-binding protein n=1 Tax=Trujillonella humicola TaxID=3383699 RepID=UPI003906D4EE